MVFFFNTYRINVVLLATPSFHLYDSYVQEIYIIVQYEVLSVSNTVANLITYII